MNRHKKIAMLVCVLLTALNIVACGQVKEDKIINTDESATSQQESNGQTVENINSETKEETIDVEGTVIQDNVSYDELKQCNDSQQEVVQQELGIAFPNSTVIDEITYYWAWGNDISRTYDIEIHMDANDYKEFSDQCSDVYPISENGMTDGCYAAIKDMTQNDKLCFVKMIYISERYTSFADWMEENGKENIGYKRMVGTLLFLCLILFSLLPIIPYKKIFKPL